MDWANAPPSRGFDETTFFYQGASLYYQWGLPWPLVRYKFSNEMQAQIQDRFQLGSGPTATLPQIDLVNDQRQALTQPLIDGVFQSDLWGALGLPAQRTR